MTAPTKTTESLEVEVATTGTEALVPLGSGRRTSKSLAEYEAGVHHYPEPIRADTVWLISFYLEVCRANDESLRAIAAKVNPTLDRSREYWYNALNGQLFKSIPTRWQEGGRAWSEYRELIEGLRRYSRAAAAAGRIEFIPTPTYHCIANLITGARALSAVIKFAAICGPTGSQKSACLKHYRTLNNHGAVIHLECPARATLPALQRKIAEAYHVGGFKLRVASSREEIIRENLNETRTIILDNVQRLYDPRAGSDQPCFNWLLELQDDTACTLVLSFTEDFVDALTAGRAKGYFEQFVGRIGGTSSIVHLPKFAPAADLRVIARAFHLDAGKGAMEYLTRWSRQDGRIRIVFARLQRAQEFARLDGRDRVTLADLAESDTYTPPAIGSDEGGAA